MAATETTWALVAARMGSTRLPGKAVVDLAGKPALERIIDRLKVVKSLDGICVATTDNPEDGTIERLARRCEVEWFRGADEDLLLRLLQAAEWFDVDTIVYITADCPLVDPAIVERAIQEFREADCSYASNRLNGYAFPIGMDVEVFKTGALARANQSTSDPRDREHVTTYIYERPQWFRLHSVEPPQHLRRPDLRLTLDTWEDLDTVRNIYNRLDTIPYFHLWHILELLDSQPELIQNADVEQVVP